MKRWLSALFGTACLAGLSLAGSNHASAQSLGSTTTNQPASTAPTGTTPLPVPGTTPTTPPSASDDMGPIVVTGSYIPTTETTSGPSPLTIISADKIAQRGDTTLVDVLSHLPETGSFTNKGIGDGNGFNGAGAYISLKGLGPQATLVLINGLRTAPFGDTANGQYAFTDLNSISVASIDHVEVLTDGGAAVYGSDAVAGVVNIILKKDLGDADAETNIQIGNTTNKDAFEQVYSQAFGLGSLDGNGNGVVVLDFYNRNSIFDGDRSYSRTPNLTDFGGFDLRSSRTFPGTFVGTQAGTPEGDNPEFSVLQASGPLTAASPNENFAENASGFPSNVQPYNYNTDSTLIPSTSRYGFYANYGYNFYGGTVTPNIDFSYRHIKTLFSEAAAGYVEGDNVNIFPDDVIPVPTTNYYNKTGQEIDIISYRFLDVGDRTVSEATDDFRVVPSISVKLPDDWLMNADLNWSYSWTSDVNGGAISIKNLQAALASSNPATAYDPFSDNPYANSPSVVNSLRASDYHDAYTSLLGQDVRFTGPLLTLPAGKVELVVGAEHRNDRFNQDYSPEDTSGDVLGESVILNTQAERSVNSGYGEVHIPVVGKGFNLPGLEALDIWGAARVDAYSDFGTTINPEARFTYYPIKDLMIRGSFSTGFRAPSLPELFAGGNQSYQFVTDPQTNTAPQVLVNGGGNAALKPEISENYNIGFVYSPSQVPDFTFHGDLYKIRYKNQIQQISAQTEVDDNSALVIRDGAGDITSITAPYANLANSLIQGIDSGFTYSLGDSMKEFGKFTLEVEGSWTLNYLTQDAPGDPFEENVGQDSSGLGAYPRYRQTTTFTWDYRSLEFVAANDYVSGTEDSQAIDAVGNSIVNRKIGAYSYYDIQASYTFDEKDHDKWSPKTGIDWMSWLDGTKITLGCDDVADSNPPSTLNYNNSPPGSDSTYADDRGRFVYGAIKKTW